MPHDLRVTDSRSHRSGTHWEGCYKEHHACALALIERLSASTTAAEVGIDSIEASLTPSLAPMFNACVVEMFNRIIANRMKGQRAVPYAPLQSTRTAEDERADVVAWLANRHLTERIERGEHVGAAKRAKETGL